MGNLFDRNPNNGFPDWYQLVCPELNQAIHIGQRNDYNCDTASLFKEKNEDWFYYAFVKPLSDAQRVQHFYPPGGDLFERLPNEILDQILDHVLPLDSFDRRRGLKHLDWGRNPSPKYVDEIRNAQATLDHIGPMTQRGMAWAWLGHDGSGYFDLHHNAEDTIDKIDPKELAQRAVPELWYRRNVRDAPCFS